MIIRRLFLSGLAMVMVSACATPDLQADHARDAHAQAVHDVAQRFAYIKPFCPTETMAKWDDSPGCLEAKARWRQISSAQFLAQMQAERQHGVAYNIIAYGLGPFVGAPPPGIEGSTMRYDSYARTMSYRDHDDYVSPLSR